MNLKQFSSLCCLLTGSSLLFKDLCLDPSSMSFEQVSEMVAKGLGGRNGSLAAGRCLPGILEVDDKVATPQAAKASAVERPKKPWEK